MPERRLHPGDVLRSDPSGVRASRHPPPDFPGIPFAKVERRAYNAALFQACEELFPDIPMASALFGLGRGLYPHFASTMIGKAIFSVAGRDYPAMAQLAPRAYSICNGSGTIEVVRAQPGLGYASTGSVWFAITSASATDRLAAEV